MRSRHQTGWVEERGRDVKRWYGHYYIYELDESGKEIRQHIGVVLGQKAKLRKWEAEKILRDVIESAAKNQPTGNKLTLHWFATERFLPMREPQWAPATKEANRYNITNGSCQPLGMCHSQNWTNSSVRLS